MKREIAWIPAIVLVLMLIASTASAYPVSLNDIVKVTGAGPNGGGELTIVNITSGNSFATFCLERTEYVGIYPPETYKVYDISNYAIGGGGGAVGGKDELDPRTKWLYYTFATGNLATTYGYVKNNTGLYGEGALQLAVWYLENEITSVGDGSYFLGLANLYGASGANLPVQVMNIYGPLPGTCPAQSFLVATPEPMTILLIGLGLVGLAGLRRKE
jgi:hypothetical protein